MSMTVKGPWNHKMRQMMSYGSFTPRVFEKSTDHGKHTAKPLTPQHALQQHLQCPRDERKENRWVQTKR